MLAFFLFFLLLLVFLHSIALASVYGAESTKMNYGGAVDLINFSLHEFVCGFRVDGIHEAKIPQSWKVFPCHWTAPPPSSWTEFLSPYSFESRTGFSLPNVNGVASYCLQITRFGGSVNRIRESGSYCNLQALHMCSRWSLTMDVTRNPLKELTKTNPLYMSCK